MQVESHFVNMIFIIGGSKFLSILTMAESNTNLC